MRKDRPKNSLQYVHLLHDNAPAHKSSTAAQFVKSEKVSVLSHTPYSPDLAQCIFFLFPKLKSTYLVADHRSRSAFGSAVYQFLMSVLKDECGNCFKKWIKRLKQCVLAKGEYYEGN